MMGFRRRSAALLLCVALFLFPVKALAAVERPAIPAENTVTQCTVWNGGRYRVESGDFAQILDILQEAGGERIDKSVARSEIEVSLTAGDTRYCYIFRTDDTLHFYTEAVTMASANVRSGIATYRGDGVRATKAKLKQFLSAQAPEFFTMNQPYGGFLGMGLFNDDDKNYVPCDSAAYNEIAGLAAQLQPITGGNMGKRLSGMNAVEVQDDPVTARYDLFENGMRVTWSDTMLPGAVAYPECSFTFSGEGYTNLLHKLRELYSANEKGPSWLGMVNHGKIMSACLYDESGRQTASISSRDKILQMLQSVRIVPDDYQFVYDSGVSLEGARKMEIDFTGGIRYTIEFSDMLLIRSSDVDYGIRYALTDGGKRFLDEYFDARNAEASA